MSVEDMATAIPHALPPPTSPRATAPVVLELVSDLCHALDAERVRYCHWKSNEGLHRSASGENDLDLLVHRADGAMFRAILRRLGFKDARLPSWKELPGIWHSYGLDRATGRLVHIHAHHQLVIGDDMTKNYHLPIEEAYLASAHRAAPFLVPDPQFEFALFVVRMVIKHCTWDAILNLQGSLSASEERELAQLLGQVDPDAVWVTMRRHLPFIEGELWRGCLSAIRPGASFWFRVSTARRLHRALAPCSRRGRARDTWLRIWRRVRTFSRRRVLGRPPTPKRLASGGTLVAVVGGDGAGKSTAVRDLTGWLAEELNATSVHLGKPPRSALSVLVKSAMVLAAKVKRSPVPSGRALRASIAGSNGGSMTPRNTARMLWEALTARDRYRAYRRARRAASNGWLVICDRFPLAEIELMDGAVSARMGDPARWGRPVRLLSRLERRYYDRIAYPDVLIVLRVPPEVALERRRGIAESILRPRSEEVWRKDWRESPAIVIDAGRPLPEVLAEIRSEVWSRL